MHHLVGHAGQSSLDANNHGGAALQRSGGDRDCCGESSVRSGREQRASNYCTGMQSNVAAPISQLASVMPVATQPTMPILLLMLPHLAVHHCVGHCTRLE
jgi:hypothetical protein